MNFKERLNQRTPILLDGGMGTVLFEKLPGYEGAFELLNSENPDVIEDIHSLYLEAGSEMIETNTFGGSRLKLAEFGLRERCEEINEKGASLARRAADRYNAFVGGSVGPTGLLAEPMGETPAETIYESFAAQMRGLSRGGADAIIIETMTDVQEAKLALLAARDNTDLPVICSMTFDLSGKTPTGSDMLTAFTTLASAGASMVGANCGMGPAQIVKLYSLSISALKEAGIPLSAWSNAGLPEMIDGKTHYGLREDSFAASSIELVEMGIQLIGGCCGTRPSHIKALADLLSQHNITSPAYSFRHRAVTSRTSRFSFEDSGLVVVGERLNPSARKAFAKDLSEGRQTFLRQEAVKQKEEGAHILDINVGLPGIDEKSAMKKSVTVLSNSVDIPLMIDSDNPEVIEAALMTCPGIPIVNSINATDKSIETILPLIKRFGCFVVGLCLDEGGIFPDSARRIAAGEKLLSRLAEAGVTSDRVFIDPLVLTESAEPGSAIETLKVISHFSSKGIKTSVGLSNISFGLPQRKFINSAFLKASIQNGLTAAIVNPVTAQFSDALELSDEEKLASDFLNGSDPGASAYIEHFKNSGGDNAAAASAPSAPPENIMELLFNYVVEGNSDDIETALDEALKDHSPSDIMNQALLQGLEKVGELYSSGEYFLPQMISSANAMKKGFLKLKPMLTDKSTPRLGRAVICTVKGDIHDIGKNIVAMMMENHGFEVTDLGKDVPCETIIQTALDSQADLICLSSLLTTTMGEMKNVRETLNQRGIDIPVMIGGAVVTDDYARSIGAHYSSDAVECVKVAKSILGV